MMATQPPLAAKLALAGALAAAALMVLTSYTGPVVGRMHEPDVAALLHQALHDAPGLDSGGPLVVEPVPAPEPRVAQEVPAPQPVAPGDLESWAARAAATDSAALRAWLERIVLSSATMDGYIRHTTIRRLTLRDGCPLLSHLRIVEDTRTRRLVSVSSDCPPAEATPLER